MIPLHEFTKSIDPHYTDPLTLCYQSGHIRPGLAMDLFEDIDRAHLAVMIVNQNRLYRLEWERIVQKNLHYKRPYLINGTFFERLNDEKDVLDEYDTQWKEILDISDTDEESFKPELKTTKTLTSLEMTEDSFMTQRKKEPLP